MDKAGEDGEELAFNKFIKILQLNELRDPLLADV